MLFLRSLKEYTLDLIKVPITLSSIFIKGFWRPWVRLEEESCPGAFSEIAAEVSRGILVQRLVAFEASWNAAGSTGAQGVQAQGTK